MSNEPAAVGVARVDDVMPWRVMGDDVRHLGGGPGQAWSLFEIRTDGPMGPPPHRHVWEELFLVTAGRLELFDGERWLVAEPGTLVRLPSFSLHTYRASTPGTRFLALISPGGSETFFRDLAEQVAMMPPDPALVMAICARHGVEIVPGEEAE
jgi:quercetin dioxygenase-like cupin family protein